MEIHKEKFPEDKVVCLAQVFTNMEFMGCKYPAETITMVGELSREVAKEFRAGRANRLKRTFVAASDATETRAKGRRLTRQPSDIQEIARKHFEVNEGDDEQPQPSKTDLFSGLKYKKYVLFLVGGLSCISLSAKRSNSIHVEKEVPGENRTKTIEIYINNMLVGSASGLSTSVKAAAFDQAMKELQEHCYSIMPKKNRDIIKIGKNNKVVGEVIKTDVEAAGEDKRLGDSNKGFRMMKLMGWSGGGLGSKKQGREDPVCYFFKYNRSGIGKNMDMHTMDMKYFRQILGNYIMSDEIRDLVFNATKQKRAWLHEIAYNLNLKSESHGRGKQRRLTISKKTVTSEQILHEVLVNKNVRYIEQYLVQVPKSKEELYPDHTKK